MVTISQQTFSFVVIDITSSSPKGLGQKHFLLAPRVKEHITMSDERGVAQDYEVIAVVHPSEPAATCGDLLVRHTGTDVEFRQSMSGTDFFSM